MSLKNNERELISLLCLHGDLGPGSRKCLLPSSTPDAGGGGGGGPGRGASRAVFFPVRVILNTQQVCWAGDRGD